MEDSARTDPADPANGALSARLSADGGLGKGLGRVFEALLLETEGALRPGTEETPRRAAEAWQEMTAGYGVDVASLLKTFDAEGYDEMVVVSGIPFQSLCEHHLLPFPGTASVGYIPSERVVGLSKIPRLVDAFAKRLQIQERLTKQIADALVEHLEPVGVMVVVEATHSCVTQRGVKKAGTAMRTSVVRGLLKDDAKARSEALALIGV